MYIKKILIYTSLIGILVMSVFSYFVYTTMFISNTNFENDFAYVYIYSNHEFEDLKQDLQPILKNLSSFERLANRKSYANNLKPGKYAIRKGMNNNEIISTLRSKKLTVDVMFNNIKDEHDLASKISNQIEADSSSIVSAIKNIDFMKVNDLDQYNFLSIYLPNSYNFYWDTSAEEFRARMLKEYKSFWNEKRINLLSKIGLTQKEVMILASIVNQESKEKSELNTIAGVYINRLNNNWKLQADPTVKFAAYQLPEYENTVIRRILFKHLKIDSKYNTYKYRGLPPGLIAIPDINSIDAVLNYENHNYFFFSADPKRIGFHTFSRTLAQHNNNAKKFHRYLDEKGIKK